MKKHSEIDHYILKVFDEEGREWAEYRGKNDLKPSTATFLLVNFRMFKLVLNLLAGLFGLIVYKILSHLF